MPEAGSTFESVRKKKNYYFVVDSGVNLPLLQSLDNFLAVSIYSLEQNYTLFFQNIGDEGKLQGR